MKLGTENKKSVWALAVLGVVAAYFVYSNVLSDSSSPTVAPKSAAVTERERAALAWTEAVTLIGENHVPDDLYRSAQQQFSEKELVDLTLAVILINSWNRLAITFRTVPGTYQPRKADIV